MFILFGIIFLLVTVFPVSANDAATAVSPNGLEFRKEKGIVIEQEKLFIDPGKIEVEYQFTNTTPNDIVTHVAFPIPEYGPEFSESLGGIPDFNDFAVQIDGTVIRPKKEVKALVNGKDYSDLLMRKNISITNFENTKRYLDSDELEKFKSKLGRDFEIFRKLGIIDEYGLPQWHVAIKYYWQMKFLAGNTVTVKHSYTPYTGFEYTFTGPIDYFIEMACLDVNTRDKIEKLFQQKRGLHKMTVPYILTTANYWKKPIKHFQLIVKRKPEQIVSICSDKTFTKVTETDLQMIVNDYIPTKDLTIYFFNEMRNGD